MKQVRCLLGGKKKVHVNRHTWAGSERQLCLRGSLNHLYGAFLLGFLWPVILLCLALSPYLVITQGPPLCVSASLSQDGFQLRGLWKG